MKIPNINCQIDIHCSINPSEDPDKIKNIISNIFPQAAIKSENFSITAKSKELQSLEKIHKVINNTQSQKSYIRYLEKNLKGDSSWFYLNKQAAFVDKIAICEEAEESPLGPIKVTITSSNIDRIIDWLAEPV